MKARIEVTEADIKAAIPCNGRACPIANAMTRLGFDRFWVFSSQVRWSGDHTSVLPTKAQEFIGSFDWGLPVGPFSFELEIPEGA